MPVSLVDRLPLPNLKVYSAGSVLLLSVAVYYALNVTSDPNWRANMTVQQSETAEAADNGAANIVKAAVISPVESPVNATKNANEQFIEVIAFMMQEPLCMWTLINMAYCALAVAGFSVQRLVFGALRVSEAQRVKDKFWNYVFYKFIFVFGVLNVQYMDEVLLWCSWFTVVGALHLLAHLCRDRFDYLSSSPNAASWAYARVFGLTLGILWVALVLMAVAVAVGLPAGKDTFAFMAAECVLLGASALHVLARFVLRARDADAAAAPAYYTHLFFDAVSLVTEVCHVAHMVVYSNAVVSMASLVLLMQLRHLLHALLARLRRHRLYAALAAHMSRNYPMASPEEVEKNQDNCAICWEPMKEARKLPCGHLFHNSCLCRWVQQDASCPTCRRALSPAPSPAAPALAPLAPLAPLPLAPRAPLAPLPPLAEARAAPRPPNHLFHFDGSRYVSWLPSFSVEVTRVREPPPQLEAMLAQVQQVFPQYARAVLLADLAATRSADRTLDNILEGRVPPPAPASAAPFEVWAPTVRAASNPANPQSPATSAATPESSVPNVPTPQSPEISEATPTSPESSVTTPQSPESRVATPLTPATSVATPLTPTTNAATPSTPALDEASSADIRPQPAHFSGSAAEREAALRRRKLALLAAARRRYLARAPPPC